jgi:hypothetical protein
MIFYSNPPISKKNRLEEVLYSVLTTRIVINIRIAGSYSNGVKTELHTIPTMVFANPGADKDTQESDSASNTGPQSAIELQQTAIYSDTSVVV